MPKVFSDVEGCNPDTVKKCIETKRNLNPLTPIYVFPGHSEPQEIGLSAFGEEGCSMANRKKNLASKVGTNTETSLPHNPSSIPPRSQTSHI